MVNNMNVLYVGERQKSIRGLPDIIVQFRTGTKGNRRNLRKEEPTCREGRGYMKIAGYEKVSLVDYPGKIATTIFSYGCNFACKYCHNKHLWDSSGEEVPFIEILDYLKSRENKIEAVVFSGGEPTINKDLLKYIWAIKKEVPGLLIKVDTNGSDTQTLKEILPFIDYVSMDIKGPMELYSDGVFQPDRVMSGYDLCQSVKTVIKYAKDYEFRITMYPEYVSPEEFYKITTILGWAKRIVLQQYNPQPGDQTVPYNIEDIKRLAEELKDESKYGLHKLQEVIVR